MIDGGCDPIYIARRVLRMASEDIGNADPRGLQIAMDAWQALERLGSPEGELAVAQAVKRQTPIGERRGLTQRDNGLNHAAQLLGLG